MSGKRYYWLKLKDDFFSSKRIKKLRKIAGGDTYTIIYLKMQLKAMKTDGMLQWTGLEDDFAAELALDIDEEVDDVKITLQYLLGCGLAESSDNINFFFPYALENVGSEGASAKRVRDYRNRKALHCNTDVTEVKRLCNGEKEIEIEIEIEKDIDEEKKYKEKKIFRPPTVDEVRAYCKERGNNVDPEMFVDFYTSKGWKVGKNPMKDWKAAVRTWERNRDGGAAHGSGQHPANDSAGNSGEGKKFHVKGRQLD